MQSGYISSSVGRNERSLRWRRRTEPRRIAPPRDSEMRQPRAPLTFVDGEIFEPRLNIVRDRGGVATGIVEDEHPDAAGLAVPHGREPNLPRAGRDVTQHGDDRV